MSDCCLHKRPPSRLKMRITGRNPSIFRQGPKVAADGIERGRVLHRSLGDLLSLAVKARC
ncbi:hypothetical protein N7463_010649 [Penicillium fimorum]|uniref:Uncharacterized protein n=1 Tax=Penicillium fimorum TaxID=1882269 RepID=A0A9W9XK97_9EURO|nr:hypothetical protein N7463_010649 [Penicillium fimorum]